jgi:hypothetical protein
MVDYVSPQPFERFVASLASARYDELRSRAGAQVEGAAAFEDMRAYVTGLYTGVTAVASFVEDDGQVVDCIPVEQYRAIGKRTMGAIELAVPTAQPVPQLYGERPSFIDASTREIGAALPGTGDRQGVEVKARYPAGTVPMWRTTLEQLSRFSSLAAFFRKERPSDVSTLAGPPPKRYATGEQDIANLGGGSHVNVWKTFATPTLQGTFSQQWYLAGHDGTLLQTVECGVHIDYGRYQDSEPHLFVFSTRNNYEDNDSIYNLDRGVYQPVDQPYVKPGARLLASQTDGTQVSYKMGFYLNAGAWYFYFDDRPVGCFPLAWFNGGPMATCATRVRFGGEVESRLPSWPVMGSGSHASGGYGRAAFQRSAFVNPVSGGGVIANLANAGSTTGPCYTVDITNNSASDWGTFLFFGGPGGQPC